jgi:urea transport system permease protein
MVFLNWHELPVAWWGFNSFAYAGLMIVLVPGLLAFAFGWFAFRSRVTGVYLSIITQALTYALKLAFFRNDFGFGGNNGLTDFKDIVGFNVQSDETRAALFSISALTLALAFVVGKAIVGSKYGKALIAVRDAESRVRFLGYRVENYKLFVWVVSAVIAGIGGALYVPQVGIINPSEFDPGNSIEAVIWVAVGGRGTLVGAALGALLVNYVKTILTGGTLAGWSVLFINYVGSLFHLNVRGATDIVAWLFNAENWLFGLGALFVLVTLFLPKGILGWFIALRPGSSPVPPSSLAKQSKIAEEGGSAQ